jgi:hypothetical protein
MSELQRRITGFLFPIPHRFIERFFSGDKDVFVKPNALVRHFRFLVAGNTIVFYDSDMRASVGEAKIKEIEYGIPSAIWSKYHSRIFLEKDEFEEYVARSPLGPRSKTVFMTAFVLEKFRRYPKPKAAPKRVTPAGYYLS